MLVYFICTGNTCRSPMAAALYYKHLMITEQITYKWKAVDWQLTKVIK